MPGFLLRKFVLVAFAIAAAAEGASSYSDAKMATDAALHGSDAPRLVKRTGPGNGDLSSGNGNHPSNGDWNLGKDAWQNDHSGNQWQQKGDEQKKGAFDNQDRVSGGDHGGDARKGSGNDSKDQGSQPTSTKGSHPGGGQFMKTSTDPQSFPNPSGQPRQRRSAKGRKPLDNVVDGNPMLIAKNVCPDNLFGCPIAEAGSLARLPANISTWFIDGFECFDLENDLRACGGCASVDKVHDCTTILGAESVSCESSRCVVQSCKQGYTLDEDENTCAPTN